MKFSPTAALKQFTSTFKEWHYLVGGLSGGFVVGWILGSLFTVLLIFLI